MADDDPSGEHATTEWPLEGHFIVGGSGLYVHRDCLGRTFTSHTADYDFEIGLPQVDTGPDPLPPEIRYLSTPRRADTLLIPPVWTYGLEETNARVYEKDQIVWGMAPSKPGTKVYPESAKDTGVVYRCRFYTTLTASDDAQFDTATEDFLSELSNWWTHFTSWVGILTSQDFLGLGGYSRPGIRSGSLETWTGNGRGRAAAQIRSYFTPNQGIPQRELKRMTSKRA